MVEIAYRPYMTYIQPVYLSTSEAPIIIYKKISNLNLCEYYMEIKFVKLSHKTVSGFVQNNIGGKILIKFHPQ